MQTKTENKDNLPCKTQIGNSLPAEHENIPALDGLRAVAVTGVILGHINEAWLPGGFMGVDVFFVLSGFLIASIIHKDLHQNTFSFRQFYQRRIQRLLPNAALAVLVTLVFIWLIGFQRMETLSARHAAWTLLNFSNIFAYQNLGDYWGIGAENSPFTHFWSLGIEEQFYFLFPLGIFLLYKIFYRYSGVKLALIFFGVLGVLSFLLGFWQSFRNPVPAFYLPPFRFWELFVGVVLALFIQPFIPKRSAQGKSLIKTVFALLGLAVLSVVYFFYDDMFPFPGWIAAVPVIASGLVILSVTTGKSIVSRLLSFRPIVQIGKYSYSLYLWHWPAIILAKFSLPFEDLEINVLIGAVAGIILSILAYYFVERPLRIRSGTGNVGKRRYVTTALLFSLAMGASFATMEKYESRKVAEELAIKGMKEKLEFAPIRYSGELYELRDGARAEPVVLEGKRKNVFWATGTGKRVNDVQFLRFIGPLPKTSLAHSVIEKNFGAPDALRVMLVGDSHAQMYGLSIEEIAVSRKLNVRFDTRTGTRLFELKKRTRAIAENIAVWKPDILIFAERWDLYRPHLLKRKLSELMQEIQPHVSTVLLVAQVPVCEYGQNENLRERINLLSIKEDSTTPKMLQDKKEGIRRKNLAILEEITQTFPVSSLIRADRFFTRPDGSVLYAEGGNFYYQDNNHLAMDGVNLVRPLFEDAIDKFIEPKKKTSAQGEEEFAGDQSPAEKAGLKSRTP
ncbi:MAG: acyltransferase [Puniceicoccales bacterium]|nr:acyltransferase [Puniceicoccales bacterium]